MRDRWRRLGAVGATLGFLGSGLLVWQSSYAAFSATTTNPDNTVAAGTVVLTDDRQPANALFDVTGLAGGDHDDACITVTYTGSLAADVRLYVEPGDLGHGVAGSLAPYLTLRVEEGTGTSPDCTDFASDRVLYNPAGSGDPTATLAAFAGASSDFVTGVGTFAPGGANQSRTYRVSYWLQDDNDAQGKNATLGLTWEAQNR